MLEVYLFGQPHITQDGKTISISRRKSMALLAYLASTGQSYSRDHLATLFWSENDQSSARNNLRRDLFELKETLGEQILATEREKVALNPKAEVWIDVCEFLAQVEKAHRHHHTVSGHEPVPLCTDCQSGLTNAVMLYSADFLAGFSLPGCREFEDWQFFQAESLRQSFAEALQLLIQWHTDRGESDPAISYGRRWLAMDPLHEPAQRQLMRLYAWSGQHAAALRQYQECVRMLHVELGIEPEEETIALNDTIRSRQFTTPSMGDTKTLETAAVSSRVHNNLPRLGSSLVGRDDVLAHIVKCLLGDANCRLLTLSGPGGIGKTHLAIEVAIRLADDPDCPFCEGICFVSLAAISQADSIVSIIADALQLPLLPDPEQRTRQLFDYVQPKRLLLLLDNFEHLVTPQSIQLLVDLLAHAPRVKLLVTSRIRLKAHAEQVFTLSGLGFPRLGVDYQEKSVEEVTAKFGAIQLFIQSAKRSRPDFLITPNNLPAVVRLCQIVEGMPLGIELAAAWLDVLTPAEITVEVEQCLDFLEANWPDRPERHHSLRAMFDSSWRLLAEPERLALMNMTLFQSSFSRQAAQATSGASIHTLLALQNKSWLKYQKDGRFQIHELLCQYANEKLRADPSAWLSAREKFCNYYADFLETQAENIKGPRQNEAFDAIAGELENIRMAWQWLVERGQVAIAVDSMLLALYRYAEARAGPFALDQLLAPAIQSLSKDSNNSYETYLLAILLTAQAGFNRFGFPERFYFVDVLHAHEDEICLAWSRVGKAAMLQELGFWGVLLPFLFSRIEESAESIQCLRELLPYFRKQNRPWELANALYLFAGMLLGNEFAGVESAVQLDEASRYLLEAKDIFEKLGDQCGTGYALHYLGILLYRQGKYLDSILKLKASIANLEEVGEWPLVAGVYNDLAGDYLRLGNFEAVFQNYHAQRQMLADKVVKLWIAVSLSEEALAALRYSNLEHTRQIRAQSISMYQESHHDLGAAWCIWEMGEVERVAGNLPGAREWYGKASALFEKLEDRTSSIFIKRGYGDIAQMTGDYRGAKKLFQKSLQLAQAVDHQWGVAYAFCGLGRAETCLGEFAAGREHFSQALKMARKMDHTDLMLISLAGFAALFTALGDVEQAVELISLVINHKLIWNETKAQMSTLLRSIKSLPPDRFAGAQERGRDLDIGDAIIRFNL